MKAGRAKGQQNKVVQYKVLLVEVTLGLSSDVARANKCTQECGKWLDILPHFCNNTVLGQQEFHDSLLL
eukprot:10885076-Ditylum_brightwellii.AAC.1